MNNDKTFVYVFTIFIAIFCCVPVIAKSSSRLLSIENLGDNNFADQGYLSSSLLAQVKDSKKKIKSIAVYRQNFQSNEMSLQDSILFNKKGFHIIRITPYNGSFNKTYYFYDNKGREYLNIYVLSNKDTLYTLKRFNHIDLQVQYNVKQKVFEYLIQKEVIPVSDAVVQVKRVQYEPDIKSHKIVPTKSLDMLIKQTNDSLVSVETKAIQYGDSLYSSTYKSNLKIKNNFLILDFLHDKFNYNIEGIWTERENDHFKIKRMFSYYEPNEEEIKISYSPNKTVLQFLNSKMNSLPKEAWINYNEKQKAYKERERIFANHMYGDSIELKEARSIEAFLPKLWYEVSISSGEITGIDSICYVVGYNTPITGNDGSLQRSLAIFQYREGKYRLIKQTFHAIDSFEDTDNDLLFDGYEETNFSVRLEEGHILIHYEYMRGEAVNEYAYENGDWILVYSSSSHRTCCYAATSSYDYKTKTVTESIIRFDNESNDELSEIPRDTVISYIDNGPIIYMDRPSF